jgi:hypothetical protein
MEETITKKQKVSRKMTFKSDNSGESPTEMDILRRAYEIYLENSSNFSDELWTKMRGKIPGKASVL